MTSKYFAYLSIILLVCAIFGQTLQFGYAIDDELIKELVPPKTELKKDIHTIFNSLYNDSDFRPVTILSFYLDQIIFGAFNARTGHIMNVLLYILLSISIYYFLLNLFGKDYRDKIILIVLLFVSHPIHADVVSNIKSRDNILSMLFLIWSLNLFTNFFKTNKVWIRFSLILLSLFIFAIAMLAKKDAICYLFLAPLIAHYFMRNEKLTFSRKTLLYLVSSLIIAISGFFIFSAIQSYPNKLANPQVEFKQGVTTFSENPTVGKYDLHENSYIRSKKLKIEALTTTSIQYIKLLTIPKDYYFYYGYNQIKIAPIYSNTWWLYLIILILIASLTVVFYRNKVFLFGAVFMVISLIYCLNYFVAIAGIVAVRYAFIASLGLCICVVSISDSWQSKVTRYYKTAIIFLIICFSITSFYRSSKWYDLEKLVNHDIKFLDDSHVAHRIAAQMYLLKAEKSINKKPDNNLLKAESHSLKANKIYDKNPINQELLALIYLRKGSFQSCQNYIELAIQNGSATAKNFQTLGDCLYFDNNLDLARAAYFKAFELNEDQNILSKISTTYFDQKRFDDLITFNNGLKEKYSSFFVPYDNLGLFYLSIGDINKAKEEFKIAIAKGMNEKLIPSSIKLSQ